MRTVLMLLLGGVMAHAEELPNFDKMWDYRKPDETEKRFRELLPAAEASGDADYHLQLLTQIARALGLQGKFDEAHALLDEIEGKLTPDLKVARVRHLLERGRTFNSSKKPEKAVPLFRAAWDRARECKADFFAVDAAHMLAIAVKDPEEKLQWNLRAMEHAEGSDDERAKKWLGVLYNNMGWDAHDRGDYEKALELHRKCLEWHRERETGMGERIAKWSVAKQLRHLKRAEEALELQHELVQEWKAAGEEDGFVYEEIGECLLDLGREEEAKTWFRRAYPLLQKIDWIEPDRLARLKKLSR